MVLGPVAKVGLPLARARHKRRMAWVTAHAPRVFPMRQWRRVLFTDESRFSLFRADDRRRVCRRRGERYVDACIVERDRFGRGSIMVLGKDLSWSKNTISCS